MALADNIISAESGGDPTAKNPNSSASGPGQFIDSTWLSMIEKNRPDLMQGRTPDQVLALRTDPQYAQLSKEMTAAYAADNAKALTAAGHPVTDGNLYLAHFAGPGGAAKVLSADPSASAASILGSDVAAANPFLRNMSAGDLAAWAQRKAGGGTGQAGSTAAPSAPAAPPMAIPQGMLSQGGPAAMPAFGADAQTPSAPMSLSPQAPTPGGQQQVAQTPGQPAAPGFTDTDPLSMRLTGAAKARLFAALANRVGTPLS